MQPGERAFDDPALAAEPRAVRALGLCDLRLDVAGAQRQGMLGGVVGAIGEQPFRGSPRATALAAHRRDAVEERQRLDVVDVAGGQSDGERLALSAADQVVLGTPPAPIHRARSCFRAPPTGGARDESINSARCSFESSTSCRRSHPGLLPLVQPPPAGHPRPAAHLLLGQIFPRDPGLQHEQDVVSTVGQRSACAPDV